MIVSCGDSFFYGSDLQDLNSTWPALVAQRLGLEYHCLAQPGVGNLRILQQVIEALDRFGPKATYLVNWTWIDRFDYWADQINWAKNKFFVNQWQTIRPAVGNEQAEFYYKQLHHTYSDKFKSLLYAKSAIDILSQKKIPFIMTFMDDLMFENSFHTRVERN